MSTLSPTTLQFVREHFSEVSEDSDGYARLVDMASDAGEIADYWQSVSDTCSVGAHAFVWHVRCLWVDLYGELEEAVRLWELFAMQRHSDLQCLDADNFEDQLDFEMESRDHFELDNGNMFPEHPCADHTLGRAEAEYALEYALRNALGDARL